MQECCQWLIVLSYRHNYERKKEFLTSFVRVGGVKQFGTTVSWQNSTQFQTRGSIVHLWVREEHWTVTGSVDGVRAERLYLKYAATCEKINRVFIFCFSEAPQKLLCLSAFSYNLFYLLSWIQTILWLTIDPNDLLYLELYIFTLLMLASESTGCFHLRPYLSQIDRTGDFPLNETQHHPSSHRRF